MSDITEPTDDPESVEPTHASNGLDDVPVDPDLPLANPSTVTEGDTSQPPTPAPETPDEPVAPADDDLQPVDTDTENATGDDDPEGDGTTADDTP